MIGSNVRRLREEREMLQADLAQRAGASACYISLIESGKRDVSMKMLNSLADALGVPTSILLEERPPNAADIPMEAEKAAI